jgi:hypothetical protein
VEYKEWIFLSPKCYSLLTKEQELEKTKTIQKAKGVHLKDTSITHESYKKVYNDGGIVNVEQTRIQSINHQLYTIKSTKKHFKL